MVLTLKRTVSTLALATLAVQGSYTIGAVYLNSIKYAISPSGGFGSIPSEEVLSPNEPDVTSALPLSEEVLKAKSLALPVEDSVPEMVPPPVEGVVPEMAEIAAEKETVVAAVVPETAEKETIDPAPNQETAGERYVVRRGDTISKIWKSLGAPYAHSLKAADAFKRAGVSLGQIREGREVRYIKNAETLVFAEFELPAGKKIALRWNGSSYDPETSEVEMQKVRTSSAGTIAGSLALAAQAHEIPFAIVDELVDVMASKVDFSKDLRDGDTFSIVYDSTFRGVELVEAELISASLYVNGRRQFAIEHTGEDGKRRYFDENGAPLGSYFLRYPVQFSRISSMFSDSRLHPVVGVRRPHNGVDFAAPIGTPVRSIGDGKVVAAGFGRANGNYVTVAHGNGFQSTYLHLSSITAGVRAGVRVVRGQRIGSVGKTGLATGPHLHFGVFKNGRYVDPLRTNFPTPPVGSGNSIPRNLLLAALNSHDLQHKAIASLSLGAEDSKLKL